MGIFSLGSRDSEELVTMIGSCTGRVDFNGNPVIKNLDIKSVKIFSMTWKHVWYAGDFVLAYLEYESETPSWQDTKVVLMTRFFAEFYGLPCPNQAGGSWSGTHKADRIMDPHFGKYKEIIARFDPKFFGIQTGINCLNAIAGRKRLDVMEDNPWTLSIRNPTPPI